MDFGKQPKRPHIRKRTHSTDSSSSDDERPWLRDETTQPVVIKKEELEDEEVEEKKKKNMKKKNGAEEKKSEECRRRVNGVKKEKVEEEVEPADERGFVCGVCDHTSYSFEAYQEHVVSEAHIHRAARVFHFDVPTKKTVKEETKDKTHHHCEICDVDCNGDACWNSHLQGAKHKKKEKQHDADMELARAAKRKGISLDEVTADKTKAFAPMSQKDFAAHPEALIGLEYVVEVIVPGEPMKFACELCDTKFDGNLKFTHLTGVKHRIKVLKERDYVETKSLEARCGKRGELTKAAKIAAQNLEGKEGRQKIRARMETVSGLVIQRSDESLASMMPSSNYEPLGAPGSKRAREINTGSDNEDDCRVGMPNSRTFFGRDRMKQERRDDSPEQRLFNYERRDSSECSRRSPQRSPSRHEGEGKRKVVMNKLIEMANCEIEDEEDATLAHHISTTLTKKLLEYRKRTSAIPSETTTKLTIPPPPSVTVIQPAPKVLPRPTDPRRQ